MASPRKPRSSRKPFPPRKPEPIIGFQERAPGQPGRYRRGELLLLYEALPKQTSALGIVFSRSGEIKFPRYETVGGELGPLKRVPGAVVVSTLPRAQRAQFHKQESVAAEYKKLFDVGSEIAHIHAYLVRHGKPLTPEEKKRLKGKLATLANTIGLRSRKESKSNAVQRLSRAIELADSNPNAMLLSLIGAHNDLAVRLSALRRMIPKTVRTMQSVASRFFSERNRSWKKIHDSRQRLAKGTLTAEGKADLQREIDSFSNRFIFDAGMVDDMRRWKSPAARTRIASNQLRLVYENIDFWQKRGEAHWVEPWMRHVVNALAKERGTQTPAEMAYHALQRKDFAAAKKALEPFAEAT
ncbi:MAG: hypothetical protein IPJ89_03245 [Candidatus Iainarchaeum archaeon]|uniref:Uncharacterized protein n=1 Tax=Candidatus Iainarchaeum sp. TaxID=3101447 RepID=A0A7T9I1L5_9ARCH|nr:MAG: hypothetical protein IPJ89_03245 [Candidatus Diapherotrites archaeon]